MNTTMLLADTVPVIPDMQNFSMAAVAAILLFWVLKTLGDRLDAIVKNQLDVKECVQNLKSEVNDLKSVIAGLENDVRRK